MTSEAVRDFEGGAVIEAWVVPGSSRSAVVGLHGDRVKLRVSAPANGGQANREAVRLLGRLLGTRVVLVRGMGSRQKVFNVAGLDAEEVLRKLGIG